MWRGRRAGDGNIPDAMMPTSTIWKQTWNGPVKCHFTIVWNGHHNIHQPRWNRLIWRFQKYPVQVVDVDATGTNWSCSKCGEEVSKERVDQVGGQQSLVAKILSNFITNNSIKCSHHWAEIGVVSSRWQIHYKHHVRLDLHHKKVEEMIGSLVGRLEPSTDCIVWRSLTWRWT